MLKKENPLLKAENQLLKAENEDHRKGGEIYLKANNVLTRQLSNRYDEIVKLKKSLENLREEYKIQQNDFQELLLKYSNKQDENEELLSQLDSKILKIGYGKEKNVKLQKRLIDQTNDYDTTKEFDAFSYNISNTNRNDNDNEQQYCSPFNLFTPNASGAQYSTDNANKSPNVSIKKQGI